MQRPISKIILHLFDVEDTDSLIAEHISKGMTEVGFHYMIEQSGVTKVGRSISLIGNHLIGHNSDSIGIALIGKEMTKKQESSIDALLEELSVKGIDTSNVFFLENGELKKYK